MAPLILNFGNRWR